jgi:hypothetical protein
MAEALDAVAEANKLEPKTVGLLIESMESVTSMIDKHVKNSKKTLDNHVSNSKEKFDATMNKIGKATGLAKNLKAKGYPVKRKANK